MGKGVSGSGVNSIRTLLVPGLDDDVRGGRDYT